MNAVFADTFYFIALQDSRDAAHAKATAFSSQFVGRLVTTEWVLLELANSMSTTALRQQFVEIRAALHTHAKVRVVPIDAGDYEAGVALYHARSDKQWSLTDCISFVVMQRESITEALTGDRHFEQAGFTALLKP